MVGACVAQPPLNMLYLLGGGYVQMAAEIGRDIRLRLGRFKSWANPARASNSVPDNPL